MAREHVLTYGNTHIGVIPEISLVSHFQVGSWEVLYRARETGNMHRWGLPLMIPNFSRLKDGIFKEKGTTLPMHGLGRDLPWTILAQDQTSITIRLTNSEATFVHYPYEFAWTAKVEAGEQTLTYTLGMENRGEEMMPIAPGFHPFFAIAQKDKVKLITDGPSGFVASAFHWDSNPPDNPYPFPHQVSIDFPGRGTLIIVELPCDDHYSLATMQIWSEPATAPDHAFVCFEPVVTSADGLNRPADRLNIAPHTTHRLVLQLTAKPL